MDVNNTIYDTGKWVLLSDIEIDPFIIDGLINEVRKIWVNANNMKNQELCDTLQNFVKYKVPNFTAEDIIRK